MKLSEFRQIIREEVRNVLNTQKRVRTLKGVVNEGEALIFDTVEPEFNDLKNKIADLNKKAVDPKWKKALDQIQREVEKLELFISKYDRQLGAIETNEEILN